MVGIQCPLTRVTAFFVLGDTDGHRLQWQHKLSHLLLQNINTRNQQDCKLWQSTSQSGVWMSTLSFFLDTSIIFNCSHWEHRASHCMQQPREQILISTLPFIYATAPTSQSWTFQKKKKDAGVITVTTAWSTSQHPVSTFLPEKNALLTHTHLQWNLNLT